MKVSFTRLAGLALLILSPSAFAQTASQTVFVPLAMYGGEVLINSTSWQQVTRTTYTSIASIFAGVPVAANTTRKYYLVIRRADNQPGGNGSNWRFSCSGAWNGGTTIPGHGFALGSDWGSPDEGSTDWVQIPPNALSSSCSTAYWEIDAEMVNSGPVMRIMSISMAAVDVAGATSPAYSQSSSGNDGIPPLSLMYDTIWTMGPGGNVGIGTQTPGYTLDVSGKIHSNTAVVYPDGSSQTTAWTGVLCGGDYAEAVTPSGGRKSYEPGDVLVLASDTNGNVERSHEPYSTLVAGIYATKPGVIGRRQSLTKDADELPMAMVGIVPTKVTAENGPIHQGDLLVTSPHAGYAMKGTDRSRMLGAVIGKAMGTLESGNGVVEVLVTLQ